jgi:hypothetical protein
LLTFAALEPVATFSKAELAYATRALPRGGSQSAAQALVRALEYEPWRVQARNARNTGAMGAPLSEGYLAQITGCHHPDSCRELRQALRCHKDAFPEALEELKHWLQPLPQPDFVVHLLHEARLCGRFANDALAFLNAVISDSGGWPPTGLNDCLNAIRSAAPELQADDRFQRLNNYLRRPG